MALVWRIGNDDLGLQLWWASTKLQRYNSSGRGAARLARTVRVGEVVGSNPAAPTDKEVTFYRWLFLLPERRFLQPEWYIAQFLRR